MARLARSARVALAAAMALAACGGDDDDAGGDRQEVVLEDDFSDAASGFTVSESDTGSLAYDDGAYVIEAIGADSLKVSDTDLDGEAFVEGLQALGDVRIEVDITKAAKDGPSVMGVLCRLDTDSLRYYAAVFDTNGWWRIARYAGTTTVLAEASQRTEVDGLEVDEAHRLRLDCVDGPGGAAVALMLDGEPVAAVVDPTPLPAGRAAMAAGTRGASTHARVRFDDLEITTLG
jgi:hypothetical protein